MINQGWAIWLKNVSRYKRFVSDNIDIFMTHLKQGLGEKYITFKKKLF